jgi:uncharacterized membrane protein YsdA (DUF1294 family)
MLIKYLIIINIICFLLMGLDKYLAIKKKYRISEKTLLLTAFLGGSIGIFLGMIIFHHKTKKTIFKLFIPLFILLHAILSIIYL